MHNRKTLKIVPHHTHFDNTPNFAVLYKQDDPQNNKDRTEMAKLGYKSLIGHLQYYNICTRLDLALVLSKLSPFLKDPGFAQELEFQGVYMTWWRFTSM